MQGDTTTNGNPNETILIPMLHKRVGDLTSENILLQAKLQWMEQEKEELIAEMGGKTQRILDLEHAETAAIETAKAAVAEKSAAELRAVVDRCEQEKAAIRSQIDAEKRVVAENWKRELQVQTATLNAQIQTLSDQLNAANAKISSLEAKTEAAKPTEPSKPEPKRKGKKDGGIMGGGTF